MRFTADLRQFAGGAPIERSVAGRPLDLFAFFQAVLEHGGFEKADPPTFRQIAKNLGVDTAKWATLRTLYYVDLLSYQQRFLDVATEPERLDTTPSSNEDGDYNGEDPPVTLDLSPEGFERMAIENDDCDGLDTGLRKSERTMRATGSATPTPPISPRLSLSSRTRGSVSPTPSLSPAPTSDTLAILEDDIAYREEPAEGISAPLRNAHVDIDDSAWLAAIDRKYTRDEQRRKRNPIFLFRNLEYMPVREPRRATEPMYQGEPSNELDRLVFNIKTVRFESRWSRQKRDTSTSVDICLAIRLDSSTQEEIAGRCTELSDDVMHQNLVSFDLKPVLRRAAKLGQQAISLDAIVQVTAGSELSGECSFKLLTLGNLAWNDAINSATHRIIEREITAARGTSRNVSLGTMKLSVCPPGYCMETAYQLFCESRNRNDTTQIGYIFPDYIPSNRMMFGYRCAWCARDFHHRDILENHLAFHHPELQFRVKVGKSPGRLMILASKPSQGKISEESKPKEPNTTTQMRDAYRNNADPVVVQRRQRALKGRENIEKLIDNGTLFHSGTWVPIRTYEDLLDDSEDEVDNSWRTLVERELMNDFVDIHPRDKILMNLWNEFVDKRGRPLGLRDIPRATEQFIDENADGLSNIRLNLRNWLEVLWRYGVIAEVSIAKLQQRHEAACSLKGDPAEMKRRLAEFSILDDVTEKTRGGGAAVRRKNLNTSSKNGGGTGKKRKVGRAG